MNIDQAYQILNGTLGKASMSINGVALTRDDHALLQQALQTLLTAAKDNQEKKKEEVEEKKDGGTDSEPIN